MINNLIDKAKEIASKVHGDQVDKKNYPYMAHIMDVASRVSHLGESYEIVGLLHDAIEDAEPESFKIEIMRLQELACLILKQVGMTFCLFLPMWVRLCPQRLEICSWQQRRDL